MTRAIVLASALLLSTSAFAGEQPASGQAPVAAKAASADSAGAASCTDEAETAEQRHAREAKLAELGRRLAEEPPVEGDFRVLNRTGHNYDARPISAAAPPAKPAAPADTKPR